MSDERHVEESAGAYVLGALTPEEAHEIEAHVATCGPCRVEIAELRDVVGVLPLAAATVNPSTDLRARIVAASRGEDRAEEVLRRVVSSRKAMPAPDFWHRPFPAWAGLAGWFGVATACVLLGIFIGVSGEHSHMMADLAQRGQPQMLNAPTAERVYSVKTEDLSSAVEFINQSQVWDLSVSKTGERMPCKVIQPPRVSHAMIVTDMPAPTKAGMVYQVWLVRDGRVHRGGVVMSGHGVQTVIPMRVHSGDVIAFTEEPRGGSAVPSGPFLMQQTL